MGLKNSWGMQSKMVFEICDGISCSLFYVKEFDVIVHKKVFSLYEPIKFLAILYPKSLANLVVEVGTGYSHQILLRTTFFLQMLWMIIQSLSNFHVGKFIWFDFNPKLIKARTYMHK